MPSRIANAVLAPLVILLAVSAGLLVAGSRQPAPELPVYGQVPAFQLTDQNGAAFSPQTMAGRVWVADVVFTRCPTVCPVVTMTMRALEKATRDLGGRVGFVSFSVDPDYDTPAVLGEFARKHGATSPRWFFATGQSDTLKQRIEEGLKIALDRGGPDAAGVPTIVHGTHFLLIDQKGRIRGYYDSVEPDRLDALKKDLRRLVAR